MYLWVIQIHVFMIHWIIYIHTLNLQLGIKRRIFTSSVLVPSYTYVKSYILDLSEYPQWPSVVVWCPCSSCLCTAWSCGSQSNLPPRGSMYTPGELVFCVQLCLFVFFCFIVWLTWFSKISFFCRCVWRGRSLRPLLWAVCQGEREHLVIWFPGPSPNRSVFAAKKFVYMCMFI